MFPSLILISLATLALSDMGIPSLEYLVHAPIGAGQVKMSNEHGWSVKLVHNHYSQYVCTGVVVSVKDSKGQQLITLVVPAWCLQGERGGPPTHALVPSDQQGENDKPVEVVYSKLLRTGKDQFGVVRLRAQTPLTGINPVALPTIDQVPPKDTKFIMAGWNENKRDQFEFIQAPVIPVAEPENGKLAKYGKITLMNYKFHKLFQFSDNKQDGENLRSAPIVVQDGDTVKLWGIPTGPDTCPRPGTSPGLYIRVEKEYEHIQNAIKGVIA